MWEKASEAERHLEIILVTGQDSFFPASVSVPDPDGCSVSVLLCLWSRASAWKRSKVTATTSSAATSTPSLISSCRDRWVAAPAAWRMESRCETPRESEIYVCFSPPPPVWREREDMGRENWEVFENVAGSFRPRLSRKFWAKYNLRRQRDAVGVCWCVFTHRFISTETAHWSCPVATMGFGKNQLVLHFNFGWLLIEHVRVSLSQRSSRALLKSSQRLTGSCFRGGSNAILMVVSSSRRLF